MLKNEEQNVVETLKPFVKGKVKKMLIYDTGSTDKTVEVSRKFLEHNKCSGEVIEEPFVDFATSRNKCLDHVDRIFKDVKLCIFIDAEWYIDNVQALLDYCKLIIQSPKRLSVYSIYVKVGTTASVSYRLFSVGGNTCFSGAVHETPFVEEATNPPETFSFAYLARVPSTERWYRDLGVLHKDIQKGSDDVVDVDLTKLGRRHAMQVSKKCDEKSRSMFYLAQTYECLKLVDNALEYYKKRIPLEGNHGEVFMSCYRMARIYSRTKKNSKALKYYMLAYEKDPSRAEPLVALAEHYSDGRIKYMFARQACSMPINKGSLFLDMEKYNYERWNQLAISAWYVGQYQEGYEALLKARSVHGDLPHIIGNLKLYEEKLGIKRVGV